MSAPSQPAAPAAASSTALVAGGSRGLGLLVAQELARRGYHVQVCARNAEELHRAQQRSAELGLTIATTVCDVTDEAAVRAWVAASDTPERPIAVAIHVAGVIQVAPLEAVTGQMIDDCVDIMTKGPAYLALAVLPGMRARGYGRLGIVASIGGVLGVPHLVPYCTAKFGAVGLGQSLRAELAGTGVKVTTILPPLMRTGSHVQAQFAGNQPAEYSWFAPGAVLPGVAMSAEKAARRLVSATLRGRPLVGLSPLSQLVLRTHGLAPATVIRGMGLMGRLLPKGQPGELLPGHQIPASRVHPVVRRLAPPQSTQPHNEHE
jgi:NAD(P)-dependent dehydrogenase (short-subunit alcohol dehydrogenase family)